MIQLKKNPVFTSAAPGHASPARGARATWGRGGAIAMAMMATMGAAQPLPSGQSVELKEVLLDRVGDQSVARFRFIAPAISRSGGDVSFAQAEPDMEHLCTHVAVPYLAEHQLAVASVVISLSDKFVEFGSSDPAATQYFDGFRLENATCIWEGF